MLYKEFIAETAQKMMATEIISFSAGELTTDNKELNVLAKGCIAAAKVLADALEEDYKNEPVDGGVKRYAEKETFFDNYVNLEQDRLMSNLTRKAGGVGEREAHGSFHTVPASSADFFKTRVRAI